MNGPGASIMVSVCLLAYNHARYIRQALDSVVQQQTDFPWEICVGEDDSSDGTREICREYAARHPDRIRLFLRSRADVIRIGGRPTGRFNLVQTLQACRGRYIALLDGDDFWLSPVKLQRQVNFLEAHPEISVCGHRVRCIDARGNPHPNLSLPQPVAAISKTHDLLERNFLATCSVVYRAGLFGDFPSWFYRVQTGDWVMHLLNSQHGDIAYLDEELAAYRLHDAGVWLSANEQQRQRWAIQGLKLLARKLGPAHRRRIREILQLRRAALADLQAHTQSAIIHRRLAAHLGSDAARAGKYWIDLLRLPVAGIQDLLRAARRRASHSSDSGTVRGN